MAAGGKRVSSYIDPELLQIIEDSMKTSTGYFICTNMIKKVTANHPSK